MFRRPLLLAAALPCLLWVQSPLPAQSPEELIDHALGYRTLSQVEARAGVVAFTVTRTDLEENAADSDIWVHDGASARTYRLTRGPKRDDNPQWSPDGEQLAFLSDRAGKPQIFLISPFGGEAEQATKFEKLAVGDFQWLPSGDGFVFTAADPPTEEEEKRKKDKNDTIVVDKDLKLTRLYRYRLGDDEPEKLTEGELHVTSFDISPDGARLAFSAAPTPKANDRSKSDLYILGLADKSLRPLLAKPGQDGSPKFSPAGGWVAFTRQADMHANSVLHRIRPDGSAMESLSASFDESVGGGFEWIGEDRIELTARKGVENRVFVLSLQDKTVRPAGPFDEGAEVESFARAPGGEAYAVLSAPDRPSELYRVSPDGRSATPVTNLNKDFLDNRPRVERLRYRSADGWDLEGVLLTPPGVAPGAKLPLLVVIHGGPSGVHTIRFRPSQGAWPIHAFVRKGYAVFLPNPRGSTGFGEEFRKAVVDDWGGGDFGDIQQGVDLLIERGTADPERMGVMGWSYGGYMTAWTITQTGRYKAASVGAGITNAISMYGTQDIPDFFESHFGGLKPWEAREAYANRSAITFVANVTTPTLIQHGAEDDRVPVGQAQELYLALGKVGVETELVLYPRQGHGIREPKLIRDALLRSFRWFDERVGAQ